MRCRCHDGSTWMRCDAMSRTPHQRCDAIRYICIRRLHSASDAMRCRCVMSAMCYHMLQHRHDAMSMRCRRSHAGRWGGKASGGPSPAYTWFWPAAGQLASQAIRCRCDVRMPADVRRCAGEAMRCDIDVWWFAMAVDAMSSSVL